MMTPQEREVITGIFERLKHGADAPRDPDAEKLIAELIARQPYAPYVMAQSIYVQEQALANLQQQVEQLQARVQQAEAQAKAPQSGGFLSSLFGGGAPAAPRPAPGYAPQQSYAQPQGGPPANPWGQAPQGAPAAAPWGQPQAAPAAGGGFLKSAVTTAAGVAGGMVVGNMLMNAFSGGHGGHGQAFAADSSGSGFGNAQQRYEDGYNDARQDFLDDQDARDDAAADADDASFGGDSGGSDDSWA